MLRPTVSRPVYLGVKHQSRAQARFLLLSDSCWFVHVGRPLWLVDGSVGYNCCWSSPAQSYLPPRNSRGYFASRVLIQFLWQPLFFFRLAPYWALSWSAEISLRLLWTCRSETNCLHEEPELSDLVLVIRCASRAGGTHFSHCGGARLCNWGQLRLLLRSTTAKDSPRVVWLEENTLPIVVLSALCDFLFRMPAASIVHQLSVAACR
jgi:hypothetical protein